MTAKTLKKADETPIQAWLTEQRSALDLARRLAAILSTPCPAGDAQERLSALEAVWNLLDPPLGSLTPHSDCAERLSAAIAGINQKENIKDAVHESLLRLEHEIARELGNGAKSDRLIYTDHFGLPSGSGIRVIDSGSVVVSTQQPILLAVGLVETLPANSPSRFILKPGEFYIYDGTPGLILGPCRNDGRPRRWYLASEAAKLTSIYRTRQAKKAEEEAERERLEKLEADRKFYNSELGRAKRLRDELDRLEREGRIPPLVPPIPAVRIGR
jgi:hypothetical protein